MPTGVKPYCTLGSQKSLKPTLELGAVESGSERSLDLFLGAEDVRIGFPHESEIPISQRGCWLRERRVQMTVESDRQNDEPSAELRFLNGGCPLLKLW